MRGGSGKFHRSGIISGNVHIFNLKQLRVKSAALQPVALGWPAIRFRAAGPYLKQSVFFQGTGAFGVFTDVFKNINSLLIGTNLKSKPSQKETGTVSPFGVSRFQKMPLGFFRQGP